MTVVYVKYLKNTEEQARRVVRKMHSAFARALLKYAVKREYGLDISDYSEAKTPSGKPYLEGAPFFFNLSHSGECVVCALSDGEVGVDVERIASHSERTLYRFCGERIESSREQMRLWTRYESYGKMTGIGIPYPVGSEKDCFFKEYTELDRYYVTVCAKKDEFADHLILLDDESGQAEILSL